MRLWPARSWNLEVSGCSRLKSVRLGRRNPKAGVPVAVPERRVAVFKMGKELKERIRNESRAVCNEVKKRGKFTARGLKDLCLFA